MSPKRAAGDEDRLVAEAAAAARRGELIVIPTETVYGIATRPDERAATRGLFEAKQRPRDLALPVLAASVEDLRSVARLDARAERLALELWPGPLTLVLPRGPVSLGWSLGSEGDTVAVRVPDHPLALAVLRAAGPLAVTSANRSGKQPGPSCEDAKQLFGDLVSVYVCGDAPHTDAARRSSTVLDLAHGAAKILRAGSLDSATLNSFLPDAEALLDSRPPR